MRASLVSREVIADSIELVARGHLFDGSSASSAATRRSPARRWRSPARPPGLVFYNGSIAPGRFRGRDVTDPGRLRGDRRVRRREDDADGAARARVGRLPGAGACGGQFTANTMAHALDFLGSARSA
jgi:dihydroxy-acid dehydratase